MNKLFRKSYGENHNFWMSYTDLMSGFLVVFIIISIVMYNHYSSQKDKYERLFDSFEGLDPEQIGERFTRLTYELDSIKGADMKNLIEEYKEVFASNSTVNAEFDLSRGSIILTSMDPNKYLFASGSAIFENSLSSYLQEVGKPMVEKTMKLWEEHNYHNVELRIEGHTDPNGYNTERGSDESFMYNLKLSSERANKVYDYILNNLGLDEKERDFVKRNMISVGYSFSTRVYENNIDDVSLDAASRRIEFRIISK